MANFLGFKQVTLAWFEANSATTDLKQYMWLVRDEENVNTSIYFGSRKYAEINNDAKAQQALDALSSLIESIGGIVDENGEYVGFLPVTGSTVLNAATTIAEALQALDEAIAANDEAIKANAEAIADNAEAIEDINDLIGEVPSGMTVVEYMLEELNKVIVAANKLNGVLVNGESVVNPETGKAEIVLTDYATKEYVDSAITVVEKEIADVEKEVEDLQKEMELTESALTKEIQERIEAVEDLQAADAEHDRLISGLTETVQELLSDNAHIITGNDVEE